MSDGGNNPFSDSWRGVWEEILNNALWSEYYDDGDFVDEDMYHFAPEGTNFLFPGNHLSDEEAYDIAMAEDGDNISWEEYLREQSLG